MALIGGQPRGYPRPFDPRTKSGKILRPMVDEIGLDAVYLDLWKNQEEENTGVISQETFNQLADFCLEGRQLVALGGYVYARLLFCVMPFHIILLPHPAARSKALRDELQHGLERLAGQLVLGGEPQNTALGPEITGKEVEHRMTIKEQIQALKAERMQVSERLLQRPDDLKARVREQNLTLEIAKLKKMGDLQ